jgi:hypothetical protein
MARSKIEQHFLAKKWQKYWQNVANSRQGCQINLDTRYQNGLKYTKRP